MDCDGDVYVSEKPDMSKIPLHNNDWYFLCDIASGTSAANKVRKDRDARGTTITGATKIERPPPKLRFCQKVHYRVSLKERFPVQGKPLREITSLRGFCQAVIGVYKGT